MAVGSDNAEAETDCHDHGASVMLRFSPPRGAHVTPLLAKASKTKLA